MTQKAGAALELGGLLVVGLGLLHGLATGDIRRELLALAAGGALFAAGWALAKHGSWQS